MLSQFLFISVGVSKIIVAKKYNGIIGIGYDKDGNILLLDKKGNIVNACTGNTKSRVHIEVSPRNMCCTRIREGNRGLAIYYIDREGLLTMLFLLSSDKNTIVHKIPVFGYKEYGVLDSVPCPDGTCMVLLAINNNKTYVELFDATKNTITKKFISNSLILQEINNSIVASIINTKYNESIIYDIVNNKPLFIVPAVKPLFKIGIPFIQLIRIENNIMVNIILYLKAGFQSFIAKPNSPFFDYFYPNIAASRNTQYYLVRSDTGNTSIIFPDGYNITVPYLLSTTSIEGLRYHEPAQAVVDVDTHTHRAILRVYYGGNASLLLVDKSWNNRISLYSSAPQNIRSLYGAFCPSKDKIVVFNYGNNEALLLTLNQSEEKVNITTLISAIILVLILTIFVGVRYARRRKG